MAERDLSGQWAVLAELRATFDKVFAAADMLDAKACSILGATGILVALATLGSAVLLRRRLGSGLLGRLGRGWRAVRDAVGSSLGGVAAQGF